jgi:NAD-dependent SIR2 family protein deacetylase
MELRDLYGRAAAELRSAGALVVTAGAGMGVDSGLPDFRGDQGFWKAYPPYEKLGLSFTDAANPAHFDRDPQFGWGFYGHRTNLYRSTVPHAGFRILLSWAERFRLPCFAVTSNVDGQFQKAGFPEDRVLEVHGSIHHLQCTTPCSSSIWTNGERFDIDEATMRSHQVPRCPNCGAVSRPNILMFGDFSWLDGRTDAQRARFEEFVQEIAGRRLLVVELGAGSAIPTIRWTSERLGRGDACVVRINPRDPDISPPHLSIAVGALEALSAIDHALSSEVPRAPHP